MSNLTRYLLLFVFILTASISFSQSNPDDKFAMLKVKLPATANSNKYVNSVRTGNLIFLSGKGPLKADGSYVIGKVGSNLTTEEGFKAAELCAINQLSILKAELGSLTKIKRIVKVTGFVNSSPDFVEQPKVLDGFSSLLIQIFGEEGKHVRSAVSVNSLPFGWAVEAEMIVEVYP